MVLNVLFCFSFFPLDFLVAQEKGMSEKRNWIRTEIFIGENKEWEKDKGLKGILNQWLKWTDMTSLH